MHVIRDKVYDKLSSFFSDSQTSNEVVDQESEARLHPKNGKSPSSMLSFLPSASFSWNRPNEQANGVTSTGSQSFQWRSKSFSLKDKPLDRTESYDDFQKENSGHGSVTSQNPDSFGSQLENSVPDAERSTSSGSSSDTFEDVFTPHSLEKSLPSFVDESVFISPDLYEFLEASLPNIVKGCQWALLYSTARHGISLNTLIRKSADLNGPSLLITGDKKGAVFGGLFDCPLKATSKRKYQGTNQSFVFTTIYGESRLFRATGVNRYFYLCLNDLIAFGGGASFALRLNEDLLSGTSGPCETFGNSCLAHDQEFVLKDVELWGFTHASQYLT
ncbi:oxidation resistance protein 1 isoform X1 [Salvia hispanica]|uniref:oxidation resistance protein 1 isoform X1 n=2 Tax=Salvia hispanica TaxID=49212 RepID=UPI002009BEAB|nr:oxidation resistance protein 1 isoform X1 [Salvia hispanica]